MTVELTKEQFDKAIEFAFRQGELWGVCYSGWFVPTETDTTQKISETQQTALGSIKPINHA